MRRSTLSFLAVLCLSFSAVACSAEAGAGDDEQATADEELRTSGITEFSIARSAGFMPPPSHGSCLPAGRWTVDLGAGTLEADACVGGKQIQVSRALTSAELKDVKGALSKLRTAKRPTACPTDAPVTSLTVKRGSTETDYVGARSACGGSKALTDTSINGLLEVAQGLTPAP